MDQQEELANFSKHVHSYLGEHIRLADQKAAFIFTVAAGLLAFLDQKGANKIWIKSLLTWTLRDLVTLVSLLSLGIGAILAIWVVTPKLRKEAGRGYIFWESIVGFASPSRYLNELSTAQPNDLTQAMLEHCYALANICQKKYRILKFSLITLAAGVFATVLLLVFAA